MPPLLLLEAPTIRSSMPSPLTSPAADTDMPALVAGVLALDLEAAGAGGDVGEVDRAGEAAGHAEHHIGRAGIGAAAVVAAAPTIRSAMPSPLTSPADGHRVAGLVVGMSRPGS